MGRVHYTGEKAIEVMQENMRKKGCTEEHIQKSTSKLKSLQEKYPNVEICRL